jgi:hypothetical protein
MLFCFRKGTRYHIDVLHPNDINFSEIYAFERLHVHVYYVCIIFVWIDDLIHCRVDLSTLIMRLVSLFHVHTDNATDNAPYQFFARIFDNVDKIVKCSRSSKVCALRPTYAVLLSVKWISGRIVTV